MKGIDAIVDQYHILPREVYELKKGSFYRTEMLNKIADCLLAK